MTVSLHVQGMDCPGCAAKLEGSIKPLPGVTSVRGEGAMVVFLFALAQVLEGRAMDRARNAVRALMELAPPGLHAYYAKERKSPDLSKRFRSASSSVFGPAKRCLWMARWVTDIPLSMKPRSQVNRFRRTRRRVTPSMQVRLWRRSWTVSLVNKHLAE